MPIIRKRLKPSDVYPEDMRYDDTTDTFQSFIDGEWVDNVEGDPRYKTVYPPRLTSDPTCDAAESVKDAFKGQIDSILLAIDNGATAFAIAGTILGLFTFGVFGVFIALALFIADQMLAAGTTALEAALTEEVWEDFKCILYCTMDENGRIDQSKMNEIQSLVASDIGGLAAGILNSMLNLAGFGGVNNLGSIGTSTGDCSECECASECSLKYQTGIAPHTSHGTIISNNGTLLRVQAGNVGGVGYAIIRAPTVGDCCYCNSVTMETGTKLANYFIPCGTPYSEPAWINATPVAQCCQLIQIQTQPGAIVAFTFGDCP